MFFKKNMKVIKIIFLGIFLFCLINLALAKEINATEKNSLAENTSAKDEINVGIYILNLGKFDISTGSFTVDFYLNLKCEEKCPEQDFEFMNGRASSIDKIIDKPNEKFYRIQANLNSQIDLRRFPFDSQKMQIIIEDKKKTTKELVYIPDIKQSGIDDSIAFTGWNIGEWTAEEKSHYYSIYNENYSQYVFTVPIYRITINSILKTFLPVIFIILVMLSSFILDPDKIATRIAMVSSSLVASVMFHVSLANQIPPVGYLTFIDKFMVLTYFVVLASFFLNVLLLEYQERKKTEIVEKIHRRTEYAVFIVVPILYAILFLFFI
jgi:hypothetical protein